MSTQTIGPYHLGEEIGRGAMGVVFRGFDPAIGRPVAIKIIDAQRFGSAVEEAELKLRLAREATAAGKLSHPNIVTVYQLGEDGGAQYLVLELVDGRSLDHTLSNGQTWNNEAALSVLTQLADALDYAHSKGVVHRDVKPANVLIRADGHVKVTDFGIARIDGQSVTRTGVTLGTPAYMSPEQIASAKVDGQTDQFSLGVIAYQMLCGRKPFNADKTPELMHQILSVEPSALHTVNPALSPRTSHVVARALAKRPQDRFASCKESAEFLADSLTPRLAAKNEQDAPATATMAPSRSAPEPKFRGRRWLGLAAGLTTISLLTAGWLFRTKRVEPPQNVASNTKVVRTEPLVAQPEKVQQYDSSGRNGTSLGNESTATMSPGLRERTPLGLARLSNETGQKSGSSMPFEVTGVLWNHANLSGTASINPSTGTVTGLNLNIASPQNLVINKILSSTTTTGKDGKTYVRIIGSTGHKFPAIRILSATATLKQYAGGVICSQRKPCGGLRSELILDDKGNWGQVEEASFLPGDSGLKHISSDAVKTAMNSARRVEAIPSVIYPAAAQPSGKTGQNLDGSVAFSIGGTLTDGAAFRGTVWINPSTGLATAMNVKIESPHGTELTTILVSTNDISASGKTYADIVGSSSSQYPNMNILLPTSTLVGYAGGPMCSKQSPCADTPQQSVISGFSKHAEFP